MKLDIKSKWTGDVIAKLDIKMMRMAIEDIYSIASLPISAEIHYRLYMHSSIDLWSILTNINSNTFIDYILSTHMFLVPISIYAIEQRMSRKGGYMIEYFNDLQCLFFEIFYDVTTNYPNIRDEMEYYLEKEIDAIGEHLDIGAVYKRMSKDIKEVKEDASQKIKGTRLQV